jgi:hypothetical protein
VKLCVRERVLNDGLHPERLQCRPSFRRTIEARVVSPGALAQDHCGDVHSRCSEFAEGRAAAQFKVVGMCSKRQDGSRSSCSSATLGS